MFVVDKVKKKYKKEILTDISFKAENGKCIAIIGKNGCGKTTLLNILSGATKADGGNIYYDDKLLSNKKLIQKYVGYVPQENPLIDEVSAIDNIKLWYGKNIDYDVISDFGIDEFIHKKISTLSGGMKRRVSIAIAVMKKPKILILDEPSAALDIYGKKEVISCIQKYVSEGGTVIISTHDREEIEICDVVYLMQLGRLENVTEKENFGM